MFDSNRDKVAKNINLYNTILNCLQILQPICSLGYYKHNNILYKTTNLVYLLNRLIVQIPKNSQNHKPSGTLRRVTNADGGGVGDGDSTRRISSKEKTSKPPTGSYSMRQQWNA